MQHASFVSVCRYPDQQSHQSIPDELESASCAEYPDYPADICSSSAEANPYLSAPLTALCHRACDYMGVHFFSLFLRDSLVFFLLIPHLSFFSPP